MCSRPAVHQRHCIQGLVQHHELHQSTRTQHLGQRTEIQRLPRPAPFAGREPGEVADATLGLDELGPLAAVEVTAQSRLLLMAIQPTYVRKRTREAHVGGWSCRTHPEAACPPAFGLPEDPRGARTGQGESKAERRERLAVRADLSL